MPDTTRSRFLADPAQIHQVVMNLCSNKSYAMKEHGGVLAASLGEVEVDSTMAAHHLDLKPGLYLRLTVSDTGTGMEWGLKSLAFDPFLTTKKQGEGGAWSWRCSTESRRKMEGPSRYEINASIFMPLDQIG